MNHEDKAKEMRRGIIDLAMEHKLEHIAPAFSIVEILMVVYENVLKENDKFILSKGHGCLALYYILQQHGFNPTISGHPDIQCDQGIECTTGSLGQGLSIGVGIALARKLRNKKGDIYVLISDGECDAGTTWESALLAAHHKLDNLTIIVDYNKLQSIGRVEDVLSLDNLSDKFKAFNCYTIEIDGHNFSEILFAFNKKVSTRPKVIIAHTIKGKGVSFMENKVEWHSRLPDTKQLEQAYEELK